MTLENMFYISQTVAAFANVVSLLFVGMEVRHSNRESRHRTIEETLQNYRAARASVVDNVDVARTWISGLQDFTALDPADKVRFLLVADGLFGNIQSFFLHHRDRRMPHELYQPQRKSLDDVLGYPGLQAAWEFRKDYFHVAFERLWKRAALPLAAADSSPRGTVKRDDFAVTEGRGRRIQQAAGGPNSAVGG